MVVDRGDTSAVADYSADLSRIRDIEASRAAEQGRYEETVAVVRDRISKTEEKLRARERMLQLLEERLSRRREGGVLQSAKDTTLPTAPSRSQLSRTTELSRTDSEIQTQGPPERQVRPLVPLLFSASLHKAATPVPHACCTAPHSARLPSRGGEFERSGAADAAPHSARPSATRRARNVELPPRSPADTTTELGQLVPRDSDSAVSSASTHAPAARCNWPFVACAAGAGLLIGGGVGWLCAHAFFGSKVIAPAAVHSVSVGGGAAAPVPVSVAAAGATSAASSAAGGAAAGAALKAAGSSSAGTNVIGAATAAASSAGAAGAAGAAHLSMSGASPAALATPYVTPAMTIPYAAEAAAGTAVTGAVVGGAVGGVTAGAAGYALLPPAQQGRPLLKL